MFVDAGIAEPYGAGGCRGDVLGFGGAGEGSERPVGLGQGHQGAEQDRKVYCKLTSLTTETLAVLCYNTWHLLGWTISVYHACCAGRLHTSCAKMTKMQSGVNRFYLYKGEKNVCFLFLFSRRCRNKQKTCTRSTASAVANHTELSSVAVQAHHFYSADMFEPPDVSNSPFV